MVQNAEATIDLLPGIIHDPDGDGNYEEHIRYARERNYIVDPWGYAVHWSDGSPALADTVEKLGSYRDWFGNDGAPPTLNGAWSTPQGVSPNGYPAAVPSVSRFDGGIYRSLFDPTSHTAANGKSRVAATERQAAELCASPDGWVTHVDVELDDSETQLGPDPTNNKYVTNVTLTDVDLSTLPSPTNGGVRIILYDDLGRTSASYPVTSFTSSGTGGTVTWSEDLDADGNADNGEDLNSNNQFDIRMLPAATFSEDSSSPIIVSRVRIEVAKSRLYSWMLTVRKGTDGQAGVDVVVTFNRGVDPENEELFPATFIAQDNKVYVQKQANGDEPFLKKGSFIFDAANARWYRIEGFDEKPTLPALLASWAYGDYDYVVRVNQDIVQQAGEDLDTASTGGQLPNGSLDAGEDANGNGALNFGSAMFMPGVVEVYPLGTKTLPESLR
ncbi:hypothetical protein OAH18_01910 [bacterium]|nr:hypothetical protein [bacterium]